MKTEHFDQWNDEKKRIHTEKRTSIYIKPRQIWFTKMGVNIGAEQNGRKSFLRPVLVLKKVGSLFFTVALTTKGKPENSFYRKINEITLSEGHWHNTNQSWLILSQVKVMDKRRFLDKVGTVGKVEFDEIKQKLTTLLL